GQTVSLRCLPVKQLTLTRAVLIEFKMLREVNHANLARIMGACLEDNMKVLVTEHCVKGSLQDLIWNVNINLDTQFKFSLCTDIINGLCYLHECPIHQHGRLTSNVCLIDNRFSVKLTDFGLPTMYSSLLVDVSSQEFQHDCLWKAPEILRSAEVCVGTMEGDIYSFGIILQELVARDAPFAAESVYMSTDEIIQKVKDGGSPPFRPSMELPAAMQHFSELIQACWAEDPKCRPTCQSVKNSIRRICGSLGDSGSLMDNLMRRMEQYANNLEKMVEEKTVELREEKKKSEELLYQILPRSVADRLKSGLRVEPQVYEGVSIYFSDIVVDLLNDVYSCFDAIIEEFDVYKVETIGDAYMVVSGLPQRNGHLHAINIANMALKIVETVREFRIRHMPGEKLRIRVGLHSGPVCAGVVGLKMPRYCLFGDTVNTASRMESSGE
ncbi:unnamed protein product, partial [Candidula unifasciata]